MIILFSSSFYHLFSSSFVHDCPCYLTFNHGHDFGHCHDCIHFRHHLRHHYDLIISILILGIVSSFHHFSLIFLIILHLPHHSHHHHFLLLLLLHLSIMFLIIFFLFHFLIAQKVVVPRYGNYSGPQETGVRKYYKVDGQVNKCRGQ